MRRALLLLGVLAFSPATAQENPVCAKFEDPLAYNACLARQGPAARAVPTRAAPILRRSAPSRRVAGRIVAASGRKRNEMVFTVGK